MNPDKPLKIGAVLLAAGEGSRMGSVPKSLLRLQGIPLLHRHLMALREILFDDIVVVTGYHHDKIEVAICDQAVRFVRNTEPERGQQSSVRLGVATLAALDTGLDVVMVVLADRLVAELVGVVMHPLGGAIKSLRKCVPTSLSMPIPSKATNKPSFRCV
jgi:CTP:molybdopterin cytidylyltransferase MocA